MLSLLSGFQYGKTAKFYVYSPGEIDLNVLIQRCKEMPRKRAPDGPTKHYSTLPQEAVKNEAFLHANPPKGLRVIFSYLKVHLF
jgi:hypothetical protein